MSKTSSVKRTVVALGVSALLAPAGLIAVADAATTKTVKLKGVVFSPKTITIKKNDRIKFLWAGGTHNLVGPKVNVAPKSSGSKTVTFKRKGSFKFLCTLHANMTVTVKVR
jgi:plastocyanin